ncbi:uncharacterized protein FSUBG_9786 [Fusarium subglutinans]|uniref:Uncharacterized protein n=1 Tax=Gibberella subglutinans TaxID=42677 RepID=A0A8H5UMS9_GIBSU|nr:uncharacterized protein FSUBG_9786 [Fusarium subglutinans]KAF5593551.1 hypothetical protein FSUBG_9786 [Fusarium subglutinans]
MGDRAQRLPILHLVYAGYGDAMYVEYSGPGNERKLMAVDGGPRDNAGTPWIDQKEGQKTAVEDAEDDSNSSARVNGTAPYWKYFLSAAKHLWYSEHHLGHVHTSRIRLSALVNTHQHADHCQGLYDLLYENYRGQATNGGDQDLVDIDSGLIMPAMTEHAPGDKRKPKKKDSEGSSYHIQSLFNDLIGGGPKMRPLDTWSRTSQNAGVYGTIEYPPVESDYGKEQHELNVSQREKGEDLTILKKEARHKPTVICLSRRAGAVPAMTINQFKQDYLQSIEKYAADFAVKLGQSTDDVAEYEGEDGDEEEGVITPETDPSELKKKYDNINYASLLMHLPGDWHSQQQQQQQKPDGGIYMTGDNTADIIHSYVRGRHFSIYKIQHHGSQLDNQLGTLGGDRKSLADAYSLNETMVLFTLLANMNPQHDLISGYRDIVDAHPEAFKWLKNTISEKLRDITGEDWQDLTKLRDVLVNRHQTILGNRRIIAKGQKDTLIALPGKLTRTKLKEIWVQVTLAVDDLGQRADEDGTKHEEHRRLFFEIDYEVSVSADRREAMRKNMNKEKTTRSRSSPVKVKLPDQTKSMSGGIQSNLQNAGGSLRDLPIDQGLNLLPPSSSPMPSEKKTRKRKFNLFPGLAFVKEEPILQERIVKSKRLAWWQRWVQTSVGERDSIAHFTLDHVRAVAQVKAFFVSFKADAYTVSAHGGRHGHPRAETLLGLALALKEQGRMATLYLTSPHSFPHVALDSLCRARGIRSTEILEKYLHVRYPATLQTMVSLTANPDMTHCERDDKETIRLKRTATDTLNVDLPFAENIHDLDNTTRALLVIGTDNEGKRLAEGDRVVSNEEFAQWAKERHDKMESLKQWAFISRSLVMYFEVSTSTGSLATDSLATHYLELKGDNDPQLTQNKPVQALVVREGWMVEGMAQRNVVVLSNPQNGFQMKGFVTAIPSVVGQFALSWDVEEEPAVQPHGQAQAATEYVRRSFVYNEASKTCEIDDAFINNDRLRKDVVHFSFKPIRQAPQPLQIMSSKSLSNVVADNFMAHVVAPEATSLVPRLGALNVQRSESATDEEEGIEVAEEEAPAPKAEANESAVANLNTDPESLRNEGAIEAVGGETEAMPRSLDTALTRELTSTAMSPLPVQGRDAGNAHTTTQNNDGSNTPSIGGKLQGNMKAFLSASQLTPEDVKNAREALVALVGDGNIDGFNMKQPHEKEILGWPVDTANSAVAFTSNGDSGDSSGPQRIVSSMAVLILKPSSGASLSVNIGRRGEISPSEGSGVLTITDARILIESPVGGPIILRLLLTCAQKPESVSSTPDDDDGSDDDYYGEASRSVTQVHITKVIRPADTISRLDKIIHEIGVANDTIRTMTVLDALALVLASDRGAVKSLYDRLPLVLASLSELLMSGKPDWTRSTGRATSSATNQMVPQSAVIAFDLDKKNATKKRQVSFGPISLRLEDVQIVVSDARLDSEHIAMYAVVGLSYMEAKGSENEPPNKAKVVEALMAVDLSLSSSTADTYTYFCLHRASSLADIAVVLGKSMDGIFKDVMLPLTSSSDATKPNADQAKIKAGSIGFVLRQSSVQRLSKCELHRVFFAIESSEFSGWKDWLPTAWVDCVQDARVDVSIFDPLESNRRVAVDVGFKLEVKVGKKTNQEKMEKEDPLFIDVSLSAVPLVANNDYDFRLDISASEHGLSLQQFLSATGLSETKIFEGIKEGVPFIPEVLDAVYVYGVSLGVSRQGGSGELSFTDWSLHVGMPNVTLIKDILTLSGVDVTLRKFSREVECFLSGTVIVRNRSQDPNEPDEVKYVNMSLQAPTPTQVGLLTVDVESTIGERGVSLADMTHAFGLPSLDHLPVLGQLARTELTFLSLVTQPMEKFDDLSIISFSTTLAHPLITMGPLEMHDLRVTIDYEASSSGDDPSSFLLAASANLLDGDLSAEIWYQRLPKNTSIGAALTANNMVPVSRLLNACLPRDMAANMASLLPFIGQLCLEESLVIFDKVDNDVAKNGLNGSNLALRRLKVTVSNQTTQLHVQSLVLEKVAIIYSASNKLSTERPDDVHPKSDNALVSAPTDQRPGSLVKKAKAKGLQSNLFVVAIIRKGAVRATIRLWASKGQETKTLSFGIFPTQANSITLGNVLSLLDFGESSLKFPQPSTKILPRVFDLSIDALEGEISDADPIVELKPMEEDDKDNSKARGDSSVPSEPTPNAKKLGLKRFHVAAHLTDPILVVSLEDPKVCIENVYLDVQYDSRPNIGLSGTLHGQIRIGNDLVNLSYIYDARVGEKVFAAHLPFGEIHPPAVANGGDDADAKEELDFATIAKSASMSPSKIAYHSDMPRVVPKPKSVGVRVRLEPTKKVEVWAAGEGSWPATVCGVKLELQSIAAFFRYTEGGFVGQVVQKPTYEAYLAGHLIFGAFASADARVSIGPERNAVFYATLKRESSASSGQKAGVLFSTIANLVATKEPKSTDTVQQSPVPGEASSIPSPIDQDNPQTPAWDSIVPSWSDSIVVSDDRPLTILADITKKELLVAATVQGHGSAVFWAHHQRQDNAVGAKPTLDQLSGQEKSTDKAETEKLGPRQYLFMLEARNIGQLWSNLNEDVDSQFDISKLSVVVISYKTSLLKIRKALEEAIVEGEKEHLPLHDVPIQVEPAKEPSTPEAPTSSHPVTSQPPGTDDSRSHAGIQFSALASDAISLSKNLPEAEMEPGAWFFADLRLGSVRDKTKTMNSVISVDLHEVPQLQQPVPSNQDKSFPPLEQASAQLWAHISKDKDSKGSIYGVSVSNLHIFAGLVTLNGSGTYTPKTRTLDIPFASLRFRLDDLSAGSEEGKPKALDFSVSLFMDKSSTRFSARGEVVPGGQSIDNPFGKMFNVRLESLMIQGSSVKQQDGKIVRACTITGAARLGGGLTSDATPSQQRRLGALIHFEQGKPVLVVVGYGAMPTEPVVAPPSNTQQSEIPTLAKPKSGTTTLSQIFKDVLETTPQGNNNKTTSWPTETHDDIVLTEAYLSYSKAQGKSQDAPMDQETRSFPPGFCVTAYLSVFDHPIMVSISIDDSQKGVVLKGTSREVVYIGNLLQLTENKSHNIEGITVSLDTTGGNKTVSYGIESGMTFLDKPGFYLSIKYTSAPSSEKQKRGFDGEASFDGNLLGWKDPKLKFGYHDGKWSFSNWQMRRPAYWPPTLKHLLAASAGGFDFNAEEAQTVNMDKALELGSKKDDCEELIKLFLNTLMQMQFTFGVSLPPMDQSAMPKTKEEKGAIVQAGTTASNDPPMTPAPTKPGKFYFMVTWDLDITLVDNFHAGTVHLQDFKFAIAFDEFKPTIPGFLEFIWKQISSTENLAEIGRKILGDKVLLGKILFKTAVEKLALEVLVALLCRKPKEAPNFYKEVKDRFKKTGDDIDKKLREKKKEYEKYPKPEEPKPNPPFEIPTWTIPLVGLPSLLKWLGRAAVKLGEGSGLAKAGSWLVRLGSTLGSSSAFWWAVGIAIVGYTGYVLVDRYYLNRAGDKSGSQPGGSGGGSDDSGGRQTGGVKEPSKPPQPAKPDLSGVPADYSAMGLIDLITLYLKHSDELENIPVEGLKDGLGAKMRKSDIPELPKIAADRYDDSAKLLSESKDSRSKAKLGIQSRMALVQEKLTATFLEGAEGNNEAVVVVDIPSDALPSSKHVPQDDYHNISCEVFATTATDDKDMNDHNLVALFHGSRRQLPLTRGDLFRSAEKVYIAVRMRVDMGDKPEESFVGEWARIMAEHTPWLEQPYGLQLKVENDKTEEDNDQQCVVITVPPSDQFAGDWELSLLATPALSAAPLQPPAIPSLSEPVEAKEAATNLIESGDNTTATAAILPSKESANVILWKSSYSCPHRGPEDIRVPVGELHAYELDVRGRDTMFLTAHAYQRAPDGTGWKDSPSAVAAQKWPIMAPPLGLQISLAGRAIRASWQPNPILPSHQYAVRLTAAENNDNIPLAAAPVFCLVGGLVTTLLEPANSEDIQDLEVTVSITVPEASVPLVTPVVRLVAQKSMTYSPAEILISDESVYDTQTHTLSLVINRSAGSFVSTGTKFSWCREDQQLRQSNDNTLPVQQVFHDTDLTVSFCHGRRAVVRIHTSDKTATTSVASRSIPGKPMLAGYYVIRATEPGVADGYIVSSKPWCLSPEAVSRDLSIGNVSVVKSITNSATDPVKIVWPKGVIDTKVEFSLYCNSAPSLQQQQTARLTSTPQPAEGNTTTTPASSNFASSGASAAYNMLRFSVDSTLCEYLLGNALGEILLLPGTIMYLSYVVRGKNTTGQYGRLVVEI